MGAPAAEVLADKGYFSGEEILAWEATGVTPYVPKPFTSGARANGRFSKQDVVCVPETDVYRCPAGQLLPRHMTSTEKSLAIHKYWDLASCRTCNIRNQCTVSENHRSNRWEHEAVIDAMHRRMDLAPYSMRRGGVSWSIHSARSKPGWARSTS